MTESDGLDRTRFTDDALPPMPTRPTSPRARRPSASRDRIPPPAHDSPPSNSGIARRQIVFILVANAIVSALISLCVVLMLRGPQPTAPAAPDAPTLVPNLQPSAIPATAEATPAQSATLDPASESSPSPTAQEVVA